MKNLIVAMVLALGCASAPLFAELCKANIEKTGFGPRGNVAVHVLQVATQAPTYDYYPYPIDFAILHKMPIGQKVIFPFEVYNTGNVKAPGTQTGLYLSTDATLSGDDSFLGDFSCDSINSGSYRNVIASITVPNVSPGNYYLLFKADDKNQVAESNEANNVASTSITLITPYIDLVGNEILVGRDTVWSGAVSLKVYHYLNNSGNLTAKKVAYRAALSTDTAWDAKDIVLETGQIDSISYNSSAPAMIRNFLIPNGLSGNYYYLFQLDPQNQIPESNEGNNGTRHLLFIRNDTIRIPSHFTGITTKTQSDCESVSLPVKACERTIRYTNTYSQMAYGVPCYFDTIFTAESDDAAKQVSLRFQNVQVGKDTICVYVDRVLTVKFTGTQVISPVSAFRSLAVMRVKTPYLPSSNEGYGFVANVSCASPLEIEENEENSEKNWRVFPNPTNGQVSVEWPNEGAYMEVFTAAGQKIGELRYPNVSFNFGSLSKGLYCVRMYDGHTVQQKTVVVQ